MNCGSLLLTRQNITVVKWNCIYSKNIFFKYEFIANRMEHKEFVVIRYKERNVVFVVTFDVNIVLIFFLSQLFPNGQQNVVFLSRCRQNKFPSLLRLKLIIFKIGFYVL